jgi:hypothetical protein
MSQGPVVSISRSLTSLNANIEPSTISEHLVPELLSGKASLPHDCELNLKISQLSVLSQLVLNLAFVPSWV